jgi:hypothetical protein
LDRGPSCYAGVSSNLLRSPILAFNRIDRRFCANPLKLSEFCLHVKLNLPFAQGRPISLLAVGSSLRISTGREGKIPFRGAAQRKISKSDQQKHTRAARARRRYQLLGLAMACSLRDSLQGFQGLSPHLTQRTSSINWLPNSLIGQATRPPGGSTATYCPTATFKE